MPGILVATADHARAGQIIGTLHVVLVARDGAEVNHKVAVAERRGGNAGRDAAGRGSHHRLDFRRCERAAVDAQIVQRAVEELLVGAVHAEAKAVTPRLYAAGIGGGELLRASQIAFHLTAVVGEGDVGPNAGGGRHPVRAMQVPGGVAKVKIHCLAAAVGILDAELVIRGDHGRGVPRFANDDIVNAARCGVDVDPEGDGQAGPADVQGGAVWRLGIAAGPVERKGVVVLARDECGVVQRAGIGVARDVGDDRAVGFVERIRQREVVQRGRGYRVGNGDTDAVRGPIAGQIACDGLDDVQPVGRKGRVPGIGVGRRLRFAAEPNAIRQELHGGHGDVIRGCRGDWHEAGYRSAGGWRGERDRRRLRFGRGGFQHQDPVAIAVAVGAGRGKRVCA